jgi:hypothetical protein
MWTPIVCGTLGTLLLFSHRPLSADNVLLTAGPVEVLVTPTGIEKVLLRDRHVLGDPRPDRGTAIRALLYTGNWKRLAEPTTDLSRSPVAVDGNGGVATVSLAGTMAAEVGGKWDWRMAVAFDGQLLKLAYEVTEVEPPAQPLVSHRLQIALPQEQILGPDRRPEHVKEPGTEVGVRTREGIEVRAQFGAEPTHFRQPAAFLVPFDGREAPLSFGDTATQLELWQGGWLQTANVFLPKPSPQASGSLALDLGPLGARKQPVRVETVPQRTPPWLVEPIQPREQPSEVLTFIQSVPAWRDMPREEKEQACAELARHFDIAECFFAYQDWRYADPTADQRREGFVRQMQDWIDAGHKHGLKMALSLSWSMPLCGSRDSSMPEAFTGEILEPETGAFTKAEGQFDWGNSEARKAALAALADIARRLRGLDYLFYNEPHFDTSTWYKVPFFSEAALADFRAFVGDGTARFPAKAYAPDTPRTDNAATQGDWRRWHDWINHLYAEMVGGQARAVAEANRDNSAYAGAIWFQASMWHGDQYGVDLDLVCAIPEITYIVCEYATAADHPGYRAFRYYADRHGKRFGTFVNVGRYDATSPGSTRYDGTPEDTRRTIRFGIDENADMIAAYPMSSFYPWSDAYNSERVAIWDEEIARLRRAMEGGP